MDSLHFKNVKFEKRSHKSCKHSQMRKIANFFRVIEIFVVLVLLSRFSTQLPVAVKNSGEYFQGLKMVLVSPRFVFILGNAIIITLFAKSGQFSAHNSGARSSLYDEFVEKSEKGRINRQSAMQFQDKQIVHEVAEDIKHAYGDGAVMKRAEDVKHVHGDGAVVKAFRRSQSENLIGEHHVQAQRVLRRSVTGICRASDACGDGSEKGSFPEDSMSNEEFRRTVEAFIARQQKFLREEESSVM